LADLVVRGGTVVTPDGVKTADVACEDGRISAIGQALPAGREEIDARGLTVLPAVLDIHVHFNEPGRTEWEGAATGSRALAAGGGTVFADMPLNSTPCTVNAREFDRKRAALEASSIADFGLWGGLVPGAVPDMAALAERGAIGFKAFMCDSGLPEFPRADDVTLLDGMAEAARLGLPVAVHAESEEITRTLAARHSGRGTEAGFRPRPEVTAFLQSRPLVAELEAIERALLFAGETGARLHIVHISAGRGVALAAEARRRGVDVSIETCAHYLHFADEDLERLGAVAKCAPPLRPAPERDALWSELLRGNVDMVTSDHSPTEPARKSGPFMAAWGGIAGVQSTLPVVLDGGYHERGLALERMADLLSANPARRFGLPRKGSIAVGNDADFALADLAESFTLSAADLQQRHKASPYVGHRFRGAVRRTIRRGETIFQDGRITATTRGQFVAASRTDA
jgi:allantoinase